MLYLVPGLAAIGGLSAWTMSNYGKRKILILQAVITIIGSCIQMLNSYEAFLTGRAISGFAFGV